LEGWVANIRFFFPLLFSFNPNSPQARLTTFLPHRNGLHCNLLFNFLSSSCPSYYSSTHCMCLSMPPDLLRGLTSCSVDLEHALSSCHRRTNERTLSLHDSPRIYILDLSNTSACCLPFIDLFIMIPPPFSSSTSHTISPRYFYSTYRQVSVHVPYVSTGMTYQGYFYSRELKQSSIMMLVLGLDR